MQVPASNGNGLQPMVETCRIATVRCYLGCRQPRRNCARLLDLLERGRLHQMHEDPPGFYAHWTPEVARLYDEVLARIEREAEEDIARRSTRGVVPNDWALRVMEGEGLLDEVG